MEENTVKNRKMKTEQNAKEHLMKGLTTFLVIFACIACYFAFLRISAIVRMFRKIIEILQPILIGLAFAYLLNPLVGRIENILISLLGKKMKNTQKLKKLSRFTAIALSILLALTLVVLLLNMVIPELYRSIRDLILSLPDQVNDAMKYFEKIKLSDSVTSEAVAAIVENGADALQTWLKTDLLKQINQMMSSVTVGVINIVGTLFDAAIGIIVSIYVLGSKETFVGQCKKMTYALLTPDHANMLLHITRKSNDIFGGFVIGKIIDSIIIGLLCFIMMTILHMPYTLLVSVIIGVTNVIPFFGPFIGAVPSTILILLDEPVKGIYFVVFVLLLQQFDGNILGPKILGNSTGLSAFWVVFSILLGGGLFGFLGMVMGVPTFAVIYYLVNMFLEQKLAKKKLPVSSEAYEKIKYLKVDGKAVRNEPDENKKEKQEKNNAD